ncbi:hypothetical protein P7L78_09095 [Tistrella bauzanensis]|uniref:hypothetical protein n=1 Tax=Tistrella TaxID=171436 RepID=UPI0031F6AF06
MLTNIKDRIDDRVGALCQRVADRLPARVIRCADGRPYLVRHLICRLPGGRRLYLHKFVGSDDANVVHDHPCRFVSLILAGCYSEQRMTHLPDINGPVLRDHCHSRGSINCIPAERWHRLVLVTPSVWSLVYRGRTRRQWSLRRIIWASAAEGRWPYRDRPMPPATDADWVGGPDGRMVRRDLEGEMSNG